MDLELVSIVESMSETDAAAPPRVSLLTKPGCHLCEDARRVVAAVSQSLGVPWEEWGPEDHAELMERHAEEIPVVFINGVQRDFWTIDPDRLERLVRAELGSA